MTESSLAGAAIVGRSGMFKGVTIPLPSAGLLIGREATGPGKLALSRDDDISRSHCSIRYDMSLNCFVITDHGSSNGTFLLPGERRLVAGKETRCSAGQLIRLGQANLFELTSPARRVQREGTQFLPTLAAGQKLDIKAIRVPWERFWHAFVLMPAGLLALAIPALIIWGGGLEVAMFVAYFGATLFVTTWITWRCLMARVLGNGIRVGPQQYPQIHALVVEASVALNIKTPMVYVIQGNGLFDLFVARYFSRRGLLIMTSNILDDLTEYGSSRELMFFIGRQLGLIASGFFEFKPIRHTLGQFAFPFYLAWVRRCNLTADRLGLLVSGELESAEMALAIVTAGRGVAASTNFDTLAEQRVDLFDSLFAKLYLVFQSYPYMVDRLCRLREFAQEAKDRGIRANAPAAIGALGLRARAIRALPMLIVHGHDLTARLELVNFLSAKFPHVKPILMVDEADGASSLPEKFERIGQRAKGAVALLTPDDLAHSAKTKLAGGPIHSRARQNVIIELGFVWARLGRQRMLLLTRGNVEMPSDLSGVDVHRFSQSPVECAEAMRDFIAALEMTS